MFRYISILCYVKLKIGQNSMSKNIFERREKVFKKADLKISACIRIIEYNNVIETGHNRVNQLQTLFCSG